MKRAHCRDGLRTQLFHFRKHIAPPADPCPSEADSASVGAPSCSPQKATMSNTERSIAEAIATEVRTNGPCRPTVRTKVIISYSFIIVST